MIYRRSAGFRVACQSVSLLLAGVVLFTFNTVLAQSSDKGWLDRPLANWNKAEGTVPRAPSGDESNAAIILRCKLTPPRATAAERAIQAAGWIPFWNFDQQLVRDGVEIVGGMRLADGMCRPVSYNLFVFVDGRYAGALSPTLMSSRTDAASGVVRIQSPNITTEFSRFTSTDPLCCPSSHVIVRYRIERSAQTVLVVPVDIRNRS